ncbi:hypothetical protein [Lentibacillus juripiscarius]|uniref:hypothetical protein n=1 Tax=Lentibacillus juripiscarius TaxID=257446 RepID=UPI0036D2592D
MNESGIYDAQDREGFDSNTSREEKAIFFFKDVLVPIMRQDVTLLSGGLLALRSLLTDFSARFWMVYGLEKPSHGLFGPLLGGLWP